MNDVVDFSKKFPDNRREREREPLLRQAQLVLLRMMKIIDYLCRKHNIRYWLCSGTLLGAVRQKGFIPWDDDLDICMPREDYERFLRIALAEFPDDMMLQTCETDPHYRYLPMPCKVRDKKSFILSPGHETEECAKGLFLDIFPVDRFHSHPLLFRKEQLLKAYHIFICKCLDSVYFTHESIIRRILAVFHPVFRFLVIRYQASVRKMIERNKTLDTKCYIGPGFDVAWSCYSGYEDIYPLSEITFEDASFFAPHSPEAYLHTQFGPDYLTPPPENKRLQHASVIKPIL
ncbi:MAG: LicD family protein [Tannerellaceae bacterium]|jgi:lipopolysaccharide cholinephosphotransferase|nr:LicD family protein [Tannerellaceae bacterium]